MYERQLLERALPRLVHGRWAQIATLNGFGSYELRRYEALSAVTTALTEGVTPDEQSAPSLTVITITPSWYGAWMQYTQQLEQVAYDPILAEMSAILGEQAGLSADTLIRNHITGDATTRYSGSATTRGGIDTTDDMIAYVDILKCVAVLETENARPADGGMYPVIIHPHTWAKLMRDTTFTALFQQETSNSPLRSGLIGTLLNCRLYVSSNAREYPDEGDSSTVDVYTAMFIGQGSYGVVGMAGLLPNLNLDAAGPDMSFGGMTGQSVMPVEIIQKGLGETGFDPLDQRGTLGWKMAHEEDVLKTEWIIALEHANDFSAV
jgi:N4-gp56 family major capsid protein